MKNRSVKFNGGILIHHNSGFSLNLDMKSKFSPKNDFYLHDIKIIESGNKYYLSAKQFVYRFFFYGHTCREIVDIAEWTPTESGQVIYEMTYKRYGFLCLNKRVIDQKTFGAGWFKNINKKDFEIIIPTSQLTIFK